MTQPEGTRRASMPGAYSLGAANRRASSPGASGPVPHEPSPRPEARGPAPARAPRTALASLAGFSLVMGLGGAVLWACRGEPPGPSVEGGRRASSLLLSSEPTGAAAKGSSPQQHASPAPSAQASASPGEPPPAWDAPWDGPTLGALSLQTPIYEKPDAKRRVGYLRHGGRTPVEPKPEKRENCKEGWYKLVEGGYVCGRHATVNMTDASLKLGIVAPTVREVLPYKYAYNAAHGTPLYRAVPSRDDMLKYEPYLEAAKKKRAHDKQDDADAGAPAADAGTELAGTVAGTAPEEARPWWEQNDPGKLNLKLSDLEQDADGTVQKRMMKGFFVAVDKTFGWNDRLWYKTTAGLVAPADRMLITKPPTTKGLEAAQGVKQVGFFLAPKGTKFQFDEGKTNLKVVGSLARHSSFALTGATATYKDAVYRQTTEGWWMKEKEGTWTEPGPAPKELQPGEKWVDVNLTRKTLVAFEGDRMVYATVVSPGKRSKNRQKDHATQPGTFRIREKHLAVTMDGDGKAAGDLPYSIEDVPYVQYYDGSYALHGAFWHNDFGRERSHGCVNLSPLDAKWVFFWSEPRLPRGWHGVWATSEHKGTLVVVHE